ncbi:hypothetical protein GCM10010266_70660 [Streptomyces griseomycini]|nr:hypothetical protein GCM10010266_70660 [Streptomyces griseomycini]GGR58052.1 hypothetical protein GCM10015536_73310 [Streptomyces griseomycini]
MLLWATLTHRAAGLILLLPPAIGSLIAVYLVHKGTRMHHAVHASGQCQHMNLAKGATKQHRTPLTAVPVVHPPSACHLPAATPRSRQTVPSA